MLSALFNWYFCRFFIYLVSFEATISELNFAVLSNYYERNFRPACAIGFNDLIEFRARAPLFVCNLFEVNEKEELNLTEYTDATFSKACFFILIPWVTCSTFKSQCCLIENQQSSRLSFYLEIFLYFD